MGYMEASMLLLSILGYLLLGIGVLLTTIIFVPYHYSVSGGNLEEPQVKGLISWLFGGLKINFRPHYKQTEIVLTLFGLTKQVKIRQKSTSANDEKDTYPSENLKTVKRKQHSTFSQYLKTDIIKKSLSAVLKIFKHCQPEKLSIAARIGFSDPSYTGLLCAFNSQFYDLFDKYDVNIQPVFDEELLEGSFLIGGKIWLPSLILVMIGFLIAKPIRNILISQLKMKIKGGFQYVR